MEEAIRFENVSKSYDGKRILENISLKIEKGEFLTIIGSSGCGKTTLIKLINKLVIQDKGNVFVNNRNLKEVDIIKLRRKIGYVVQNTGLFSHMNIRENISYTLKLEKSKTKLEIKNRVNELLNIVSLEKDILDRFPRELSGGQCQRVGIARALANNPQILLMDEPFGAVDEITRQGLQEELKKIHEKEGVTIIFITHDIKEALKLGRRVIVMEELKIVQDDSPKNIIENPRTEFVKQLIRNK